MGEITSAVVAFNGIAVREFNTFPGKIWGRSAKWLDSKTFERISSKDAEAQFIAGNKVLYTSGGYTAFVVYNVNGRTPTKAR